MTAHGCACCRYILIIIQLINRPCARNGASCQGRRDFHPLIPDLLSAGSVTYSPSRPLYPACPAGPGDRTGAHFTGATSAFKATNKKGLQVFLIPCKPFFLMETKTGVTRRYYRIGPLEFVGKQKGVLNRSLFSFFVFLR